MRHPLYYLPVPMGSPLSFFGGDATKYGLPTTQTVNGGPQDFLYPPANTADTTYTSTLKNNANGNKACKVSTSPDYTGRRRVEVLQQDGRGPEHRTDRNRRAQPLARLHLVGHLGGPPRR